MIKIFYIKATVVIITIVYLLTGFTFSSCTNKANNPKLPNIVFVFADDQRANTIHALGNEEIITPNLDRLAAEGIYFTNTYIMGSYSAAVCQPSRAMLLTGKYLNNLTEDGARIPPADTLIGQRLLEAGYNCFGTGKYHNDPESFSRGFNIGKDIFFGGMYDHWNVPLHAYDSTKDIVLKHLPVIKNFYRSNEVSYERGEYAYSGKHSTDIFTEATIDYILNYDSDKPFFIYTAFMTPHDPRSTHQRYFDMYDTASISIPPNFLPHHPFDNGELKIRDELLAAFPRTKFEIKVHLRDYYALITHNDEKLGEIIEALRAKGVYDNTIFIYSGDNGLALGQHGLMGKQNLYEHSTKVPLIISGKGIAPGGKSDALVYLSDLYPTICEMLGISTPRSVDGKGFFNLIENPAGTHRRYIVTAYKTYQRAIRDDQYKLIRYYVDGVEHTQLFDLADDPYEVNNLAGEPFYNTILTNLNLALSDQLKMLNDTTGWVD